MDGMGREHFLIDCISILMYDIVDWLFLWPRASDMTGMEEPSASMAVARECLKQWEP